MDSVTISSMNISGIMSGFLIPLLKLHGYSATWHFRMHLFLLLHTGEHIFQNVAPVPPQGLTQTPELQKRRVWWGL